VLLADTVRKVLLVVLVHEFLVVDEENELRDWDGSVLVIYHSSGVHELNALFVLLVL